jgi:hypothetical protein
MRQRLIGIVISGLSLALLPAASASAEEFTCRGTVGARTLDNVRVPEGATCVLEGTRVEGTITVQDDATLRARSVRVIGNVQGENASLVVVAAGSRVGGSVQVVQGGAARVKRSHVTGDIQFDEQNRALKVVRNDVGGNVQVFQNTGGAEIRRNTIDGNLQCKENVPAPTGGGNVVGGNKEDQCSRL